MVGDHLGAVLGLSILEANLKRRGKCEMGHVKKITRVEAGAKSVGSKKPSNIEDVVMRFLT